MIDGFFGEYRWLSNFHLAEVTYEGVKYPSVENAYQASKWPKESRTPFTKCSASDAKKYGKTMRPAPWWIDARIGIMEDLVLQKFTQHPDLQNLLLATDGQEIVEGNYWGDQFWGVCKGEGENNLGKIIMRVRQYVSRTTKN